MNKETLGAGAADAQPGGRAGGRGGRGSAETPRPQGSQFSALRAPAAGPGTRGPAQRATPAKIRAAAPGPDGAEPEGPRFGPGKPTVSGTPRRRRPRAAGLHLLNEAPALGGFAQEPPVVVGVGGGPVLLLHAVLRRPAPASETRGPASAAPPRAALPRLPRGRRVLLPHLPPSGGV